MHIHTNSPAIAIISRYAAPLERLARRMIVHKHRAPDIVKWAFESVEEAGQFHEGPQLRSLLIAKTKDMALGFNRAIEIHNSTKENGFALNNTHLSKTKPSTSR
ncbi:MAG: hypothetical protein EOO43_04750 [Flavobacterium sp.]|nr:MAG: hypothetical protein EOO43_04750 [Flavobacterium sp.]